MKCSRCDGKDPNCYVCKDHHCSICGQLIIGPVQGDLFGNKMCLECFAKHQDEEEEDQP